MGRVHAFHLEPDARWWGRLSIKDFLCERRVHLGSASISPLIGFTVALKRRKLK